jgi:AcrR family transcriptional regulator
VAVVTGGARGSYAKGRARREEIVQVALDVFATQGFRGGSLSTIAKRVGLSEAGVVHHFPSKEHLMLEVLRLREAEEWAGARAVTAGDEALAWGERLVEAGRHIVSRPELARLDSTLAAESLDPEHPAHAWFRDRNRRLRRELADGLRGEQRRGGFPAGADPDLVAAHVLAVLAGLQTHWLIAPDEVDLVAVLTDYLAPYTAETFGKRSRSTS